jgi:hypothetical protein
VGKVDPWNLIYGSVLNWHALSDWLVESPCMSPQRMIRWLEYRSGIVVSAEHASA